MNFLFITLFRKRKTESQATTSSANKNNNTHTTIASTSAVANSNLNTSTLGIEGEENDVDEENMYQENDIENSIQLQQSSQLINSGVTAGVGLPTSPDLAAISRQSLDNEEALRKIKNQLTEIKTQTSGSISNPTTSQIHQISTIDSSRNEDQVVSACSKIVPIPTSAGAASATNTRVTKISKLKSKFFKIVKKN